ncbi:uncharacterized protein troap isoform X3 [Amphiprion ocellaris]|uniref:uncharacterized protein troap isoform X3 n=1 Tax=Amphiprion ocellaris TaxID=80972 RepID=UPI002410F09A|nr:uncharacterized protein troap isoform X3 [Amphiprion ocellaris]
MDSSSVLRQQSQNTIHSDFQRMKNDHNKRQAEPKSSKPVSVSHLSNKDSENKPPGNSEISRKAPVRPGVSRLPVLAKSVHLQTPTNFSQSHSRWEEKPLAGKTKKKKPCTRPVPFNLSQPKNTRVENQQTVPKSRTDAFPKNNIDSSKPAKHPAVLNRNVDSTKAREGKFHAKTTEGASHLSGPSKTFKTSATLSKPDNTMHQNKAGSSVQPALNAEVCLNDMNLLSLKDASKISNASQTKQVAAQDNPSEDLTGEKFQPDHAALLSVLRNEGVSVTSLASAAPQSKPFNCLPQRVSIMKSQKKAGPSTASVKSVQFTPDLVALQSILQNQGVKDLGFVGITAQESVCPPGRGTSIYTPQRVSVMKSRQKAGPSTANTLFSVDPAALQSILQNEGVKAGGPVGATPRNSEYPPGRGTSIYSAQRVPVRKANAQATPEPGGPLKETPLKKWNPQRVRNTRHQPMSAMKWHQSIQQSPYGTPGFRSCKNNPQPQQEQEVVQRLFDDEEDEQSKNVTEKAPETQVEQLPSQASPIKSHHEEKPETSRTNGDDDEEEERMQKFEGGQMFLQAPHRESVIVFSTGKKLIRAPYFKTQETSSQQDQRGPVSSEQKKLLPVHDDKSTQSQPTSQNNPSVQRLHRDLVVQKSSMSPVATMLAMLRKRLPPLEELRMDEEVATYTSVSVPALPVCPPPRPRCGNPLASTLHFEESTRFVPIDLDPSSAPSSPQQERSFALQEQNLKLSK